LSGSGRAAAPLHRFVAMSQPAARAGVKARAANAGVSHVCKASGAAASRHCKTRKFLMPIAVTCSRGAEVTERSDSLIHQMDLMSILACSRNDNG
jgi:hypothetical protein